MKTLEELSKSNADEYREEVEGYMISATEALVKRAFLLRQNAIYRSCNPGMPKDKSLDETDQIIRGGDQYLREYEDIMMMSWKVSSVNLNGVREVVVENVPDELLELGEKAIRDNLKGNPDNEKREGKGTIIAPITNWAEVFELALSSLSEILPLPYDIFEGAFWIEDGKFYFN